MYVSVFCEPWTTVIPGLRLSRCLAFLSPRSNGTSNNSEKKGTYAPKRFLDAKKKSLGATERNEEERAAWRENASKLPTEDLVFLDECGSHIALTPLYARVPKGER